MLSKKVILIKGIGLNKTDIEELQKTIRKIRRRGKVEYVMDFRNKSAASLLWKNWPQKMLQQIRTHMRTIKNRLF